MTPIPIAACACMSFCVTFVRFCKLPDFYYFLPCISAVPDCRTRNIRACELWSVSFDETYLSLIPAHIDCKYIVNFKLGQDRMQRWKSKAYIYFILLKFQFDGVRPGNVFLYTAYFTRFKNRIYVGSLTLEITVRIREKNLDLCHSIRIIRIITD